MKESPSTPGAGGISRRGFLKTAGVGVAATSLLDAKAGGVRLQEGPPVLKGETERRLQAERRREGRQGRHRHHPPRAPAGSARPDGHQDGVRPRVVRRLHGAPRREARELVPAARGRRRGQRRQDHRGPREGRRAPPAAAGVRRRGRAPVRLLHAGHGDVLQGAARQERGARRARTSRTPSPATSAAAGPTSTCSAPPRRPPR